MFGYLAQIKGFRYVSWAMFAMSGVFAVILPFVLDETRGSVLLSRKAAKLRKVTGDDRYQSKADYERASLVEMFRTSLGRPVRMLLTEPVLVAITLWISFTWAVLCESDELYLSGKTMLTLSASDLFLVSIPYVYGRVYHFSTGEAGLVYITQFLGSCIGMGAHLSCEQPCQSERCLVFARSVRSVLRSLLPPKCREARSGSPTLLGM